MPNTLKIQTPVSTTGRLLWALWSSDAARDGQRKVTLAGHYASRITKGATT
jgi:hypothetical protein